ncbi:hypothetical protein H4R33_004821 [Dimargaris cristalligena]|nr:hypothetical protein H4R33_004821 [Dimargaris cristalligena]
MVYGTPCLVTLCLLWILALGQGLGYPSNPQGSPTTNPTDGGLDLFDGNEFLGLFSDPYFPLNDPLSPTSDMFTDHRQLPTTENAMEMDPQIDAKQVPNLANVYSGDLLHEPAFDIEEYLNFDDTDDAQLTDPAGSPLPSAPNQQLNLPNPSGESELNHAGNSSTGEAGSEASGGIASAQLGTFDLGPLDPATRLDLLRHIALLRNSPHFVLPDPKRQRIDSASSTAAINQPEIQMHTPVRFGERECRLQG